MADKNEILSIFKQLLNEILESKKLTKSTIGTVTSLDPITIKISQKISIKEPMLIVPERFSDHYIYLENKEEITEKLKMKRNLEVGNKVLLLQNNGGAEYIILDRLVN